MTYRAKRSAYKQTMPFVLGVGIMLAWVVTLVLGMATAFFIAGERVTESFADVAAVIILCVATFASAFIAGRLAGRKQMIISLICGTGYFLSLICVQVLVFEGEMSGLLGAALTITGCALISGFLQTRQKKQRFAHFKSSRIA